MKTRIEVPVWLLVLSASLHLLWTVGLVVVLIVAATPPPLPGVVTVVEAWVTATPLPSTTTYEPASQPTVTDEGVVLDTSGVKQVEVVGKERMSFFTAPNGQPYRIDSADEEFLVVYLRFSGTTTRADLEPWFADNATLLPAVVDENGYQTDWQGVFRNNNEEKDDHFGLTLVFVVKKAAKEFTLIFPDDARVDLSLVPDVVTAEGTATPVPSPTATPFFQQP